MHNLIIDGRSLKDFGIYVSGENTYNAPSWAVETSTVPGRHGELLQTMDRLEPISVSYPAFIRQKFPELHIEKSHQHKEVIQYIS